MQIPMHTYDYTFLETAPVSVPILNLTARIYALREQTANALPDNAKLFDRLETQAKIASVTSSNAIEGIVTTDARISELAEGALPLTHDEAEIAGYNDVLNLIHTEFEDMVFDEKSVLAMHKMMLAKSGAPDGGKYKSADNFILEYSARGEKKIRFKPVPAKETKSAMKQLMLAYGEAKDNAAINPLLLIPCVVLDFLCIHPFRDGNGRISRLISLLLLYQCGFTAGRYSSLEAKIDAARELYYTGLKTSSAGWNENKNNYLPFIEFFLRMLYESYLELSNTVAENRAGSKSDRIEKAVLTALVPVSKAEICRSLPDVSPTTVEAVLGKLVREGRVIKSGAARSTKYFRAK
ncbi:MAG TPA: Fic family protein [Methanocorpusculum sp.]|nr:Fic family protein [Methanocorpusculum sp.]